jgi:poly(3-hydroxybutyrate) depolymerase
MKQLLIFFLAFNISCHNKNISQDTEESKLKSGFFEIVQKWSQEPNGYARKIYVKFPDKKLEKYPVVIVLHGNGGDASKFVNKFNYINNHIIIAPQGYLKSWNIRKEKSKAPDINFIAETVSYLKKMKNIEPENISIFGSSNGSALVNQLLIEFEDNSFKKAICKVSQLNSFQYRDSKFWAQSENNLFNTPSLPKQGRKILCLAGSNDRIANYYGGQGVLGYVFLNAQNSAYLLAKAMGYNGLEITDDLSEEGPKNFFKYSYLDDQVIHYRLQGAGHGFGDMTPNANKIIKDFIELN